MPRSTIGIATVLGTLLASAGCANDREWSVRKMLGWEEVKTPAGPKLPRSSHEAALRVENLGNKIIGLNAFPGIEPMFRTIGIPEAAHFHRGTSELFISEGLVKQCKTDAELAAVLCWELGQMVAEKKGLRRANADRESIPSVSLPGGTSVMGGGTPEMPGRQAELALQDRQIRSAASTADAIDSTRQARDLLRGAGFDPAELDRVQPLLKQSARGAALRKQISGSAAPPPWDE